MTTSLRRPPVRGHHPRLAILLALGLGAAACGSSAGSASPSDSADPSAPDTNRSAIEDELGFGLREFGLTDEEWTSVVEGVQADIAQCMSEAGFEYIPADVDTVELAMLAVRTEPGMERRDYKEQWGFGVTTRSDNRVKEIELGERNLAIYNSLSDADRVAYDRTLYGEDPDATFAFQFDEEDFEPIGGCTLAAVDANFTPEQLDPNFVNPKDLLVEDHPRVIAADLAWTDCMAASGYDYEDQDEIIEEYGDRLDELLDGDDPELLPPARASALSNLQAEEIEVSLVDLECQIAHVDHVVREVEIEVFGKEVS